MAFLLGVLLVVLFVCVAKIKKLPFYAAVIISVAVFSFANLLPFSPAFDVFENASWLSHLRDGFSTEGIWKTQFNWAVTNKVSMLIYTVFSLPFSNLHVFLKIFNTLLGFGTAIFTAFAVGSLVGKEKTGKALIITSLCYPFIVLTGSYVYNLAIFFGALSLFLYLRKSLAARLCFVLPTAVLIIIRPTAAVFVLVYCGLDMLRLLFKKKKWLLNLGMIAGVFLVAACLKLILGGVLYNAELHPYPKLTDAAGIWTLNVGTRYLGSDSGRYLESDNDTSNPTDDAFRDVFILRSVLERNDPADYEEVVALKKQVTDDVIARAIENYWFHPKTIAKFLVYKTRNLYGGPIYMYAPNYTNPSAARELAVNLGADATLMYMALLTVFFGACIFYIFRRRDLEELFLAGGAWVTIAVLILLTEVSLRYLLDIFVPISAVAALLVLKLADMVPEKVSARVRHKRLVHGAAATVAALLVALCFSGNDLKYFYRAGIAAEQNGDFVTISMDFSREPDGRYELWNPSTDEWYALPLTAPLEVPKGTLLVLWVDKEGKGAVPININGFYIDELLS
ncbi:MAG: hypothetical protein LBO63_01845 [Oscillospiraceae bacterium]|jgi:hypothetical protein|nr:hypothetical protein [Oscillospiraceae bacterium]